MSNRKAAEMPGIETHYEDQQLDTLELIQKKFELKDLEEVTEWLLKSRIRKHSRNITGKGRSIKLVDRTPSCE
ncbi:hypothetical protein GN109_01645 [Collimonas pratensis]|uniref:hypothetical protein n=1 Tax=Collimonas pratensis TaxID=279113 RepID=UPI00143CCED7|nr:hypothetical protein [Collimonas pratensis]NKI68109.1 hypothetical protein [Collimonas pratensis]